MSSHPDDASDPSIFEGVAAHAMTVAEMGGTDDEVREQVLALLGQLHTDDLSGVAAAAASAVRRFPQPAEDTADERERMEPIRRFLGITSPEVQLTAALRARGVLEQLAAELGD